MGIFDVFKAIKEQKACGGPYGLVARNCAAYYYAICQDAIGKNLNEDEKLFAVGLLDADPYIRAGQISYDDINLAVTSSKVGSLYSGTYFSSTHKMLDKLEDNQRLIDFIMQLEVLIFEHDSALYGKALVDALLEKKDSIIAIVNKTLLEGSNNDFYKIANISVTNCLNYPGILDTIHKYGNSSV